MSRKVVEVTHFKNGTCDHCNGVRVSGSLRKVVYIDLGKFAEIVIENCPDCGNSDEYIIDKKSFIVA